MRNPPQGARPLSFLGQGRYQVATWADATDEKDPNQLAYEKRTMSAGDTLPLRLKSGGGQVARLHPVTAK